jgi:hypothetical protein
MSAYLVAPDQADLGTSRDEHRTVSPRCHRADIARQANLTENYGTLDGNASRRIADSVPSPAAPAPMA